MRIRHFAAPTFASTILGYREPTLLVLLPQGTPNPILSKALSTAAGAVSGAVGGVVFVAATGNVNPAALGGATLAGAVVGGYVAYAAPNGYRIVGSPARDFGLPGRGRS